MSANIPVHKTMMTKKKDGVFYLLKERSGEVFKLDGIGEEIWELCNGERTVEQIVQNLVFLYDIDPEQLENDVQEFIGEMVEQKFLTYKEND